MKPDWERDGIQLYCSDCMDVLPHLIGVDAVVTDPPYGIGENNKKNLSRIIPNPKWNNPRAIDYGDFSWDSQPATREQIEATISIGDEHIIWGGNYFSVPPSKCWLVWDKETSGDFADCELAWTDLNRSVKQIKYLWNGFRKAKPEKRYHPTQKPLAVIEWCLGWLKDGGSILDPFMGSGTTGVACVNTDRRFIGIEKEPKYFEIAVKRISEAMDIPKQMRIGGGF